MMNYLEMMVTPGISGLIGVGLGAFLNRKKDKVQVESQIVELYQQSLTDLKQRYEEKFKDLKTSYEEKFKDLKTSYEEKFKDLKTSYEEKIQNMEKKYVNLKRDFEMYKKHHP